MPLMKDWREWIVIEDDVVDLGQREFFEPVFSRAEMDQISVEQASIVVEEAQVKEETRTAIEEYVDNLYEGMADPDETLHKAKDLLKKDLKEYFLADARQGKQYIYHYVNDFQGDHKNRCMFCC